MRTAKFPKVQIRDLTLKDVEDRYQWFFDKEVTKHLNKPEKYPPFSRKETQSWIEMCINKTNGYEQKAIVTEEGEHIDMKIENQQFITPINDTSITPGTLTWL
jgi:RimJ/RimL family protein N-acetyltransferase